MPTSGCLHILGRVLWGGFEVTFGFESHESLDWLGCTILSIISFSSWLWEMWRLQAVVLMFWSWGNIYLYFPPFLFPGFETQFESLIASSTAVERSCVSRVGYSRFCGFWAHLTWACSCTLIYLSQTFQKLQHYFRSIFVSLLNTSWVLGSVLIKRHL